MTMIACQDLSERVAEGQVVGGIDTHQDSHTGAVVDAAGRVLGTETFPADAGGYRALLAWMGGFGVLARIGIEGTGSYGAGLAHYLQTRSVPIIEVDRPDRTTRRAQGKSDPLDAVAAAHAAWSGRAVGVPKEHGGPVDALRCLRIARHDAVQARARTLTRIKSLLVTIPEPLRARLRTLSKTALIRACAGLRPGAGDPLDLAQADPHVAAKIALRQLARRYQYLSADITELDARIEPLVAALAPDLLSRLGVGPETGAQLLVSAGDNPERLHSEAGFAALAGVSPIPASSGKTSGRHRLNRSGDRQANRVLYLITLVRLSRDPRTQAYLQRRTAQGRSKPEIIRCIKRYIARELYPDILAASTA